ncbi:MAG: DUF1648 domain-containing protein [Chitinophagaceae bacterium]|nr:DUF1648 domain-containing protein [Chitinophagaceae bacterium]
MAPRIITVVNVLLILLHAVLLAINYSEFPAKVPSHVGISGAIDAYEDKSFVFQIPVINAVIFLVLEFLRSKPHILNYGTPVTDRNRESMYKGMQLFISILSFIVTAIFFSISSYLYLSFNSIFLWLALSLMLVLYAVGTALVTKKVAGK